MINLYKGALTEQEGVFDNRNDSAVDKAVPLIVNANKTAVKNEPLGDGHEKY